ncbi:MAG: hypothetical protein ACW98K_13045 [Candidatus Kariarchaeaceae archaeon]|jgi:hypothetical protein
MSVTLESLRELIAKHDMTVADLEFIIEYLVKENISPQLAMRRIKSFDALQAKMEDTSDQEVIQELKEKEKTLSEQLEEKEKILKEKLDEQQKNLKALIDEKTAIEREKQDLENQTDLFDTERDELRNQLSMLQEMQMGPDDDDYDDDTRSRVLSQFLHDVEKIIMDKEELTSVLLPLHEALSSILTEPDTFSFDKEDYLKTINDFGLETPASGSIKTAPVTGSSPMTGGPPITERKSEPVSEKKTEKVEKVSAEDRPIMEKPAAKPKKKPVKEKSDTKVDAKTTQILNLFLDFITEAEDDKSFQDRISTISDMDEAYEHLGSIGLSQIYSFVSKGVEKKEELIKLLKQWKIEGVPR